MKEEEEEIIIEEEEQKPALSPEEEENPCAVQNGAWECHFYQFINMPAICCVPFLL